MKKDKDHCIICGKNHYWNIGTFQSGMDWEGQIIAIACTDCGNKIKAKEVPHSQIQDYVFLAIEILEGKS